MVRNQRAEQGVGPYQGPARLRPMIYEAETLGALWGASLHTVSEVQCQKLNIHTVGSEILVQR
jgi:hypothetical protein